MISILVTGSDGQLGSCIKEVASDYPGLNFTFTDRAKLDITDHEAVSEFMDKHRFRYCINAAAYTNVEQAEEEADKAFLVNSKAAGIVAACCAKTGCVVIHISTDYVFDGQKRTPYIESDATGPLSVYGASKLAGETQVIEHCPQHFIFRTSWLYSLYGHNFLKSVRNWLDQQKSLSITTEQTGTPTNGHELAVKILDLIKSGCEDFGLYHLSNEGEGTWFDFARQIELKAMGPSSNQVSQTDHYPTKATRPNYSVLSNAKANKILGIEMLDWRVSLDTLLDR